MYIYFADTSEIFAAVLEADYEMKENPFVGEDGDTHHGVFDINFLMGIPNVIICEPEIYEYDQKLRM